MFFYHFPISFIGRNTMSHHASYVTDTFYKRKMPTMTYGAECWTMKKKAERLMNKIEMRMLRGIQGVSLRDHIN